MNTKKNKDTLEVVNPFDLKPIGSVPLSDWGHIDKHLNTAYKLSKKRGSELPSYQRIEILKKAAKIMEGQFEKLAYTIANEGGKPLQDARVEVTRAINGMTLCIESLSHLTGQQIPMDLTPAGAQRVAYTTREPIGPVVAISAFNHPLNLIVHQVAPAIAVGCPVLIRPANNTPLSAQTFVNILYEAGLPEVWCRFIACDVSHAEKMVIDPRTAFFSFIGSANVGWMLRSKLSPGTRCALEHGGVAPVIIDETADIDTMIPSLLKGGFYHSGQVCVSVQRVFAPQEQAEHIAQTLASGASKLTVGNAIQETTDCGPLIQPKEVDRVDSWIQEAKNSGAQILCGGEKLSATTYAPTVLLNPPPDTKISTLEIFGPAVCVYGYTNLDAAIEQANALPYAFQASVFTNKLDVAMHCIQHIDASAVMVNDHSAFRVDWMPFAGRKQSGYGVGGIGYTMHDMTQEKMAVIKL